MKNLFNKHLKWKTTLVASDKTIKDAIINLNKSTLKIVLIVDSKTNSFLGTVSDGDIRRGFLKGLKLNSQIIRVLNKKPTIVKKNKASESYKIPKHSNDISQIPLINNFNKVEGLLIENKNNFDKKILDNNFLIMAGGKGKRLMPLTKYIPKPMLKIDGTPILEHIILNAKKNKFRNFYISVNYLKAAIKKYFKDGDALNVNIQYIEEKNPTGTAGSLKLLKKDNQLPIVVCNGDVLCDVDYEDLLQFHKKNKSIATMVIKSKSESLKYGVAFNKDSKLIGLSEKPSYNYNIITGIYILNYDVIKYINKKNFNMTDLFLKLIKLKKKTFIYPIFENWEDVSSRFKK